MNGQGALNDHRDQYGMIRAPRDANGIPRCPRCGGAVPNEEQPGEYEGALSRLDNMTEICSRCGGEEAMAGIERPTGDDAPNEQPNAAIMVRGVDNPCAAERACVDGEDGATIGFDLLLPDAPEGYWDTHPHEKDAWYRTICAHDVFMAGVFSGLLTFEQMDAMVPSELHEVFYGLLLPHAEQCGVLSADVAPYLLCQDSIDWHTFLADSRFLLHRTAEAAMRLGPCDDIESEAGDA